MVATVASEWRALQEQPPERAWVPLMGTPEWLAWLREREAAGVPELPPALARKMEALVERELEGCE